MNELIQLWLPILVAAASVFVASSLIHMVLKWHNSDYKKLSNEDAVAAAVRAGSPAPGQYMFPHCADMKDMQSEEMQKKFRDGPVAMLTVRKSGPPTIGGALLRWFALNLVVATAAVAIALQTFGLSANPHDAGHLVALISFLTYTGGSVQTGIWMGKPWISVAKDVLDGLIYGTVSGLAVMFLWPH